MKIQVKTSYPWAGIKGENCLIEVPNNISIEEINRITFEYALDLIFNRGVNWNYEIIKEDEKQC